MYVKLGIKRDSLLFTPNPLKGANQDAKKVPFRGFRGKRNGIDARASRVSVQFFVLETCVSKSETRVSKLETCVSMLETCVSKSETCVSMLETCVSKPETCVSKPETCVSMLETCVSKSVTHVSKSETRVSESETCVSELYIYEYTSGNMQYKG